MNIDVYRARKHEHLVSLFCDSSNASSVFSTNKELMIFAALVAYELNLYKPLDVDHEDKIKISLETYANTGHDAYIYLLGLTRNTSVEALSDEQLPKTVKHFEAYCHAGLNKINDWLLSNTIENIRSEVLFSKAFEHLQSL